MSELKFGESKVSIDIEQFDGKKFRLELGSALHMVIDVKDSAELQKIETRSLLDVFICCVDPTIKMEISKIRKDLKGDAWMIYYEIQKEFK